MPPLRLYWGDFQGRNATTGETRRYTWATYQGATARVHQRRQVRGGFKYFWEVMRPNAAETRSGTENTREAAQKAAEKHLVESCDGMRDRNASDQRRVPK